MPLFLYRCRFVDLGIALRCPNESSTFIFPDLKKVPPRREPKIKTVKSYLETMADVQSSLASLQEYKDLRANATNITRPQWSNIDVFQDPSTGEVIQLCHLVTIAPFVVSSGFEYTAGVSLAAHHLNSGDGTIIHEVEGLNESCPIRFTLESFDSFYDPGQALQAFEASVTRRDPQGPDSKACAIIGPSISSAAGPVSVAGGVLDIPSISGSTTSPDLEDKSLYPLFARTIPSDEGTSVSLALFFRDVMKANHLAMIHLNNAYGNGFKEALNTAILTYAPDMRLLSIPFSADPSAIARIVSSVKASGYRHIFCLIYSPEENDALMTEAYKQGIAGDGRHNWFFGDAFTGVLNGRVFEVGSPLFQAYL